MSAIFGSGGVGTPVSEEIAKKWPVSEIDTKIIPLSKFKEIYGNDLSSLVKAYAAASFSDASTSAFTTVKETQEFSQDHDLRRLLLEKTGGKPTVIPLKLKFPGKLPLHIVTDPACIRKILKVSEQDDETGCYTNFEKATCPEAIKELYPEINISEEELSVVASIDKNKEYRESLSIIDFPSLYFSVFFIVQNIVDFSEENFEGHLSNIHELCNALTIGVIGRCIFGHNLDKENLIKLSKATREIKEFLSEKKSEKFRDKIIEEYQSQARIISSLTEKYLQDETSVIGQMKVKGFTDAQILLSVTRILFTASDYLAEQLTFTLMHLALNPNLQQQIREEACVVKQFYLTKKVSEESIRLLNVRFIFWRSLQQDSVMIIRNKETAYYYPHPIKKEEKLGCFTYYASRCPATFKEPEKFDIHNRQIRDDHNAFDFDNSSFPSEALNNVVIQSVVNILLDSFTLSTENKEAIPVYGKNFTRLKQDFFATLTKIHS